MTPHPKRYDDHNPQTIKRLNLSSSSTKTFTAIHAYLAMSFVVNAAKHTCPKGQDGSALSKLFTNVYSLESQH